MKICVPTYNDDRLSINTDLSTAKYLLIYSGLCSDYEIVDISKLNLGQKVQYMLDNNIMHLVAFVTIEQHYKYITSRGITIYNPNTNMNAYENAYAVDSNKINPNYTNY